MSSVFTFPAFCFLLFREAVVAVDRHTEKETEDFLPQKRSRLYGIATTNTQCPQGTASVTSDSRQNSHVCSKHSYAYMWPMLGQ